MKDITTLESIANKLLDINKEIFQRTGKAPQLAVYISHSTLSEMCTEAWRNYNLNQNTHSERELLDSTSVVGYPIYRLDDLVPKHTAYSIVEVHFNGESTT